MKKKLIALLLSLTIAAAGLVGGTIAYLTDTDSDVNVMTLGNVEIDQKENGENGFEDGTDLYPIYLPADKTDWREANGVVKKTVTVENTGKSDAYVRTWFAFEAGDLTWNEFEKYILLDLNEGTESPWEWAWDKTRTYEIKNEKGEAGNYYIAVAVLEKKLEDGQTTDPSLIQLAMAPEADSTVMEAFGELYRVLVFSQAMQTVNFEDVGAAEALAIGFADEAVTDGAIGVNHPWEKGFEQNYPPVTADTWDGTADTSWYNDTDTEFMIMTAEQLAGFGKLVDEGNTFEGKTIKLGKDIDLYAVDADGERISFNPIGYGYNTVFKGTFDGQGYTIKNLYQNGWALGLDYSTEGGGLFASVVDATIKNLTIDNAEIVMECIDMGTVVGYSYGNCTYENITVKNSVIANYNRYTGGVVGEVNGTQTFKNVDVIDSTVSALWGTYDASCGGIIGGKWGAANITMEDCDVSAKLDVFNDACSNYMYYNYRLCGMLIGMSEEVTDGTATASYLTAKNCTVTYGDWANYTYCEFESNGQGSYNDPDEWKFSRVQEGYATGGVDPNHTHDTDESHEVLLVFDQLFGGDKGVKGGTAHPGVTVVYNNK